MAVFLYVFIFFFALSSHAPSGMEVDSHTWPGGPRCEGSWQWVSHLPDQGNIPQSNACPGPAFPALGQRWPPKVSILCQDVLAAWAGGDEGLVPHPWSTPWCCQPWTAGRDGHMCPGSVLCSGGMEVPAGGRRWWWKAGLSRSTQPGRGSGHGAGMERGRPGGTRYRGLWEDSWEPISERQRGPGRQDCAWAEALSSRHVPLSHLTSSHTMIKLLGISRQVPQSLQPPVQGSSDLLSELVLCNTPPKPVHPSHTEWGKVNSKTSSALSVIESALNTNHHPDCVPIAPNAALLPVTCYQERTSFKKASPIVLFLSFECWCCLSFSDNKARILHVVCESLVWSSWDPPDPLTSGSSLLPHCHLSLLLFILRISLVHN